MIDASAASSYLVTKDQSVLHLKCSGEAKGWIPSEAASLDSKPPAELVLLLHLESKCLFIAVLLELGLVGLFPSLVKWVTQTSVLLLTVGSSQGQWKTSGPKNLSVESKRGQMTSSAHQKQKMGDREGIDSSIHRVWPVTL